MMLRVCVVVTLISKKIYNRKHTGTRHIVVAAGTRSRSVNRRLTEILDLIENDLLREGRVKETQNILRRLRQTLLKRL